MLQRDASTAWPRVSVVVPTLNEARNLPHVFARLPADVYEVIVVDGHSVDGTPEVARQLRPDVRVVTQTRKGKGNALACGFEAATGDVIAMVDADGSADPGEIPQFVKALTEGADFAKGTRFTGGAGSSDITWLRRLGNRVLSGLVNVFYGTRYSDLCYGYNVFWRRHVPVFGLDAASPPPAGHNGRLWGDGFEVETLINIRVAVAGLTVAEVPSFEHPRINGVSNLNAFSDGLRVLRIPAGVRKLLAPGSAKNDRRTLGFDASTGEQQCSCADPYAIADRDGPSVRDRIPRAVLTYRVMTGEDHHLHAERAVVADSHRRYRLDEHACVHVGAASDGQVARLAGEDKAHAGRGSHRRACGLVDQSTSGAWHPHRSAESAEDLVTPRQAEVLP
jgi:hypothetical protein